MSNEATIMVTIGGVLLLALAASELGRRTPVPRVTLLLVLGLALGSTGFDILPENTESWFPLLSNTALAMVGFLIGGHLTPGRIAGHGRSILLVSLVVTLLTGGIVFGALAAIGVRLELALLLAAASTATAPAATVAVTEDMRAHGPFTDTLLGIVALDDVWGIIGFSMALGVAGVTLGNGGPTDVLLSGGWELGGALGLGAALGLVAAPLSGRIRPGQPTLLEALGLVLLCAGLALWLEVSLLLSAVTLGAAIANMAKHHTRPFHAIENVEWPFLTVFFVLSGASLETDAIAGAGLVGVAYVVARTGGRLIGARLGSTVAGAGSMVGRWMGLALLPQAGVALGMALLVEQRFPELAGDMVTIVVLSTVVFEVVGPWCTQAAVRKAGEEHVQHHANSRTNRQSEREESPMG